MKLDEIAKRIASHLARFEADKTINAPQVVGGSKLRPYFHTHAFRAGRYVGVCYVSYQGACNITHDEARAYLAWLDAGNVGTHWHAEISAGGE